MADAAYEVFLKPSRDFTGLFLIDDEVLLAAGVQDFAPYRNDPMQPLLADLFVDPADPAPDRLLSISATGGDHSGHGTGLHTIQQQQRDSK